MADPFRFPTEIDAERMYGIGGTNNPDEPADEQVDVSSAAAFDDDSIVHPHAQVAKGESYIDRTDLDKLKIALSAHEDAYTSEQIDSAIKALGVKIYDNRTYKDEPRGVSDALANLKRVGETTLQAMGVPAAQALLLPAAGQALQASDEFATNFNESMARRSTYDPIASGLQSGANVAKLGKAVIGKLNDAVFPNSENTPLTFLGDQLTTTPTQVLFALPQAIGASMLGPLAVSKAFKPNAEIQEAVKMGQKVTAAELSGSKGLGNLEAFLNWLPNSGSPVDKIKLARSEANRITQQTMATREVKGQLEEQLAHLSARKDEEARHLVAATNKQLSDVNLKLRNLTEESDEVIKRHIRDTGEEQSAIAKEIAEREAQKRVGERSLAEGAKNLQGKFRDAKGADYEDLKGVEQQLETLRKQSSEKNVKPLWDEVAQKAKNHKPLRANNTDSYVARNLADLESIDKISKGASESKVLGALDIIEEGLVPADSSGVKTLGAEAAVKATKDLRAMIEATKDKNAKRILEGLRASILKDIEVSGDEGLAKAVSAAREGTTKHHLTFTNDVIEALERKDPQGLLDAASKTTESWRAVKLAGGDTVVNKLKEANYRRLFTHLLDESVEPEQFWQSYRKKFLNNDTVFDDLLSSKDVDNIDGIVRGRKVTSDEFGAKTQQITQDLRKKTRSASERLSDILRAKDEGEQRLADSARNIETSGKEAVNKIQTEKGIAEFNFKTKADEELARRKKEIDDSLFNRNRPGDTGEARLRRAGERDTTVNQVFNTASGFGGAAVAAGAMGMGSGWGMRGAAIALGAQGIRLTPKLAAKLYMSDSGQKLMLALVRERAGTPEAGKAAAKLATYLSTQKMFKGNQYEE